MNPAFGIGVHDYPPIRHYLSIETEPLRKLLYDTRVAPSNGPNAFMNVSYGISQMRQGMYAFHVETGPGYNEVEKTFFEHEKCGLIEIKFIYYASDAWFAMQKHSPYKEILKIK